MSTTYSPLSEADDSENQLAQVITDLQDLKNTVNAQNSINLKLEDKIEEQNTTILKLEGDIEEQNAINLKLEGNIEEQNTNIQKLEGNIGQQNHTILQLEDEMKELKTMDHQELVATSLESPEMEIIVPPLDSLSQDSTPENDEPHDQSNDGKSHSYYRRPCSLVYISYGFRFLFTCTVWDRTYNSRFVIAPLLLFFSVVPLFSRRHKNETSLILYCTRIAGWLVNLAGAIVFFFIGKDLYDDSSYYFDANQRISFILLAFGHSIELAHLLLFTDRLEYKAYTVSLSCCIAGFLLRIISENMLLYIAGSTLIVIHALAQYVGIFYEPPPPRVSTSPPEVPAHDDTVQQDLEPLPEADMLDSFTFMMVSDDIKVWNFGFLIFLIQLILSIIILIDQVVLSKTSILFDAPITVDLFTTLAQLIGLFLCTFWQSDILESIKVLDMFWFKKGYEREWPYEWPYEEIHAQDNTFWTWLDKVLLPNALRFVGGILVLGTSFVIIVKSNDVIDLFKDFTALILISQIDNIAFSLAHQCYFGDKLKDESDRIKRIRVNDTSHYRIYGIPIRLFAVLVISAVVFGGWAYFVIGQRSDIFLLKEHKFKFPNCNVTNPTLIGDGTCRGGDYNTKECGFDGGDCIEFNTRYPGCIVEDPDKLNNNKCDGGDYNTAVCGFDGGACIEFPDCNVPVRSYIGDGICDRKYNTAECGFDGGDCCDVPDPSIIGNGDCDGGEYNTPECSFDGGDCIAFNKLYQNCNVDRPSNIGDGICWGGAYNTKECSFDGGDCIEFNSKYSDCDVEDLTLIGDGECIDKDYNTEECSFDGGDCIEFNSKYPDCNAKYPYYIGDGECDGGEYNTAECGFDGGDCCDVPYPSWIGDGDCDGGDYNTPECGFDGGDCIEFNSKYPDCNVGSPHLIGDGRCHDDYGDYNTTECGFDGGDCL